MRLQLPSLVVLGPMRTTDVGHERVAISPRSSEVLDNPGDHAQPGPPGKAVAKGLARSMDRCRVLPPWAVAQQVENTT